MMNTSVKLLSLLSLLAVASMMLAASPVSAEVDNDQGTETYYSYTYNFEFEGTDAETILWDFGFDNPDGTRATSTEWNPRDVVFPAKGDYVVTQTVSNPLGSYVSVLTLRVLGTPEVTFNSNGGPEIAMKTVKSGTHCEQPAAERSGYTLEGWYTDANLTDRWDFNNDAVSMHMTLYAKWTEGSAPAPGGDENNEKDDEKAIVIDLPSVFALTVSALGCAVAYSAFSYRIDRRWLVIGLIAACLGAVWFVYPMIGGV